MYRNSSARSATVRPGGCGIGAPMLSQPHLSIDSHTMRWPQVSSPAPAASPAKATVTRSAGRGGAAGGRSGVPGSRTTPATAVKDADNQVDTANTYVFAWATNLKILTGVTYKVTTPALMAEWEKIQAESETSSNLKFTF